MIPDFYTPRDTWPEQIERIVELLGRVTAVEQLSGRALELRRTNRIGSVHSSTAIEGNVLTLAEVDAVAHGEPVFGPPRDVQEVQNALAAYDALEGLDPYAVDDFLGAHALLTAGLIAESGAFRTVDVEIVGVDGAVLHTGSRHARVPRLVGELLEWGGASTDHPLVVSSAMHFLIEHIHPFRDGNGRIGRLWQTLVLSRWRPIFAWMPTETLVRAHQARYYEALQASREPEIDAAPFIDFMLGVITESLQDYEARALTSAGSVGTSGGTNVGTSEAILAALEAEPALTAVALGDRLGRSARTVERHLADLRAQGRLRREGSTKAGRWVVIDR
ncbi:Fic family protein [Luteimicrobium sp. DT211]|uniref:Fic family protein n=1 Tax=Luteimicrobium sp. DT211 TaxID=3393412 RepID=UPI003CEE692B